mmetsp:Transcript_17955/g.53418  ORF Transcript_17955/g.53418 Transcript_17955/m.53418 type:complete len:232 (+) Transcript_17955:172-867(+)
MDSCARSMTGAHAPRRRSSCMISVIAASRSSPWYHLLRAARTSSSQSIGRSAARGVVYGSGIRASVMTGVLSCARAPARPVEAPVQRASKPSSTAVSVSSENNNLVPSSPVQSTRCSRSRATSAGIIDSRTPRVSTKCVTAQTGPKTPSSADCTMAFLKSETDLTKAWTAAASAPSVAFFHEAVCVTMVMRFWWLRSSRWNMSATYEKRVEGSSRSIWPFGPMVALKRART